MEFLGRCDNQVKIRGFRIELEEIEALLLKHSAVRQVVVVAREDDGGDKRLVAYVVYKRSPGPTINELRSFLLKRLPDYMIPAAFVQLEALPLLPNGKVNRKALPAPSQARPELGHAYVAPRTPMETVLERIWAESLGLEQVGIHDNLFELGGNSLQAARAVARVRQRLSRDVSFRHIFDFPTPAALAEILAENADSNDDASPCPLKRVPRTSEIPLSFHQQRLWFLTQLVPDMTAYNIQFAIRLSGQLVLSALQWSLNQIIQRHEALRTTFQMNEGKPVQVISTSVDLGMPLVDLQYVSENQREETVRRVARDEGNIPFDLAAGPLIRVKLLKFDEHEHILFIIVHHIVFDGWSIDVFVQELGICYNARLTGKSEPLPALPIQYADFSVWQQNYLQGEVLTSLLRYWKEALADNDGILELPTDRPRPAVQSYRGATKSVVLRSELNAELLSFSRREDVTPFMTLLAAFQVLLYRYSSQSDIFVGCPVANRTYPETEGLIGFFVNTLVLRSGLSDKMNFRELLKQVREMCLRAYEHQLIPFEKLVEELQPERSLSHNPLIQVVFAFQGALLPAQELQDPDCSNNAESLVYVIYTSGSTGKPKGAMLPHRGICNRLLWMQAAYQLSEDDRVLHKTSINFDVSGWELFWPLVTGACLVLA